MQGEIKEIRRLNHLLNTQRLTPSERSALEQQMKELERSQTSQSIPTTAGVFGIFDRPGPGKHDPDPVVLEAEAQTETKEPSSTPTTEPAESPPPSDELSADEFEVLADQ